VPQIRSIMGAMRKKAVCAAGRLSLSEAVALMEMSDVYVGVDSGPMHIAAFVRKPVVAIFGPTDPAKVGPYGQSHRIIRRTELDCLACRKRYCNECLCMQRIASRDVFSATVELLGW